MSSVQGGKRLRGRPWPQELGFTFVKRLSQDGRIDRVEARGKCGSRVWLSAEQFQKRMENHRLSLGVTASGDTLLMTGTKAFVATSNGHGVFNPQPVSKSAAIEIVARGQIATGIVGTQVGEKMLERIQSAGVRVSALRNIPGV